MRDVYLLWLPVIEELHETNAPGVQPDHHHDLALALLRHTKSSYI